MIVPGSNLLSIAFRAIAPIKVQYLQFQSRALNAVGQYISAYAAPVDVMASVQAVSRGAYKQFGLDFQKNYVAIYVSVDAVDIDRNVTGDKFILPDGRIYQLENQDDWFGADGGWQGINGWVGLLAVKVDFA